MKKVGMPRGKVVLKPAKPLTVSAPAEPKAKVATGKLPNLKKAMWSMKDTEENVKNVRGGKPRKGLG